LLNGYFSTFAAMNRVLFFSTGVYSAWVWLGLGLAVVLLRGLFLAVMDVDASQYASISMEMVQGGRWLWVMHRGGDYLDKPPLLFWAAGSAFRVFGMSSWAYKLPSVLMALGGVWATYRFALLYYPVQVARHAAFILGSSVGFLLMCNDVRTDTLLMGSTALAVWQFAAYIEHRKWRHWIGAFFFVGLAMLAKGPIGLVMPAFAVGAHLMWQRDWRNLFRWEWLAGLLLTTVVLAPMCWGLWQQFDLHPEKLVNGRTGVSGLYFFFWEQSFGRITGENVWENDTSGFYFLHVYMWAFLPWSLVLVSSLWRLRPPYWANLAEMYSVGGLVLTFVALSLSRYKLPHYIFITLPWAAVLVARYVHSAFSSEGGGVRVKFWTAWLLNFTVLVLALGAFLLVGFVFPASSPMIWGVTTAIFGWLGWHIVKRPVPEGADVLVQRGVLAVVGVMFVLNFHFYPHLLPYQSTSAVAQFAQKNGIPAERMAHYGRHGHALDFYSGRILPDAKNPEFAQAVADSLGELWLYTTVPGRADLDEAGVAYTVVKEFWHYQVALLSAGFLNPATREARLEPVFLLKLTRRTTPAESADD